MKSVPDSLICIRDGAARGVDAVMAVSAQQCRQFGHDAPWELGPVKSQRGVELHKAGTNQNLRIGLPAIRHTTDTD